MSDRQGVGLHQVKHKEDKWERNVMRDNIGKQITLGFTVHGPHLPTPLKLDIDIKLSIFYMQQLYNANYCLC